MSDPTRVFAYQNGGVMLHADPIAVHRKFTRVLDGNPEAVLRDAAGPGEGTPETPADVLRRLDAEERLAKAARVAFDLPAFDPQTGKGHTDDDALGVLWAWLDWLQKKSVTPASTPTSPRPTAPAC